MRKRIIFLVLVPTIGLISPSFAEVVRIKAGEKFTTSSGEVVSCEPLNCRIEYVYVGAKYVVKLPEGKEYGSYPTKDKAMEEVKSLIDLKICSSVQLKDKEQ